MANNPSNNDIVNRDMHLIKSLTRHSLGLPFEDGTIYMYITMRDKHG